MPPVHRLGQRALLALRTVRHLKPRQMAALLARGRPATPRPRVSARLAPWDPRAAAALAGLGPVDTPSAVQARADAFAASWIEMLGHAEPLDAVWPDGGSHGPLWRYHVQYHDVLADAAWSAHRDGDARAVARIAARLESWMDRWERGGAPAWDAYPTSVRLTNWMRVLGWIGTDLPAGLRERMLAGHAAHVDLVDRRLERHLQGNHLLRNASALVVGAHAWAGARQSGLAAHARELFYQQLHAQVGADGVHEERSPMYHARALRDALDVVAVLDGVGEPVPDPVRERVRAMAEATPWLRRVDGTLCLLNDTAGDHGVDVDGALGLAHRLVCASSAGPEGVRAFRDARLVVAVDGRAGDRLMIDVGAPAPPHQPGHAHAGALGIELDLGGLPVVVDPGCSGYDGDPFRSYFRGTAAHNTVAIDGRDQSEMWGAFRVARRAAVALSRCEGGVASLRVEAECTPYHDRGAAHYRVVRRDGRTITVEDRIDGAGGKRLDAHWHLHPDWSAHAGGAGVLLEHASGARAVLTVEGQDALALHRGERAASGEPSCGWYARGFGAVVPTWSLRATVLRNDGRTLRTRIEPSGR